MKNIKSHFTFTKQQRNGIFLLLLLILILQGIIYYVKQHHKRSAINTEEWTPFIAEIDSLRQIEGKAKTPEIFPFNPNYITDFKGYTLGMTSEEIDRLLGFRAQDKWINSAKQFQEVTQVSDSLLAEIAPYFKFPEWVTNPKPKTNFQFSDKEKTYAQKIDLNQATAAQLEQVYGVGEKLSARILKYRNKFEGGFIADVQLHDIYGLSEELIARILKNFTVKTPRKINKINLNQATRDQLVTIQYIDYEIAHQIIEARTLRDGFSTLDDLTKVKNFPVHKIEIIKLYLTLN